MNLLGVIAEYNPFHNGHKYQLDEAKKLLNPDATVVVMSGNFTQRGSLASYDKWTRTKCALSNGADLVIELPVTFATGSAERFAFGGVYLLDRMGVKNIAFGSESPLKELNSIVEKLTSSDFSIDSPSDTPFHIARQKAIDDTSILNMPNNILAVEYLKAIKALNSSIVPCSIQRVGTGYNDMTVNNGFASATKVRELIKNNSEYKDVIPNSVYDILEHSVFADDEKLFKNIQYSIISKNAEELSEYAHIREGIENRIFKYAHMANSLDELIKSIKSKRYTYTSVSRMLISILLGIKTANLPTTPEYIRVLGLNDNGAKALKFIKTNSPLPVITKVSATNTLSISAYKNLDADIKASDIYYLCAGIHSIGRPDYSNSPIKL